MDPIIAGSLISAGANIFGGVMGAESAKESRAIQQQQLALQAQAATSGLRWKANDAREAEKGFGINALTLLGANPSMPAPVSVGDVGNPLGEGIRGAGQDIGRAVAALADKNKRMDELNEQLIAAKIANVNADTVRLQAGASAIMTKLGQPGTGPGVPLPTEDPRGPVIQLYQRARDYRTGDIIDIPSEKAASPLQTLAASPINAGMASRTLWDALSSPFVGGAGGGFVAPGAAGRSVDNYNWTYGVP